MSGYTGHGVGTGVLQVHSIGEEYPYCIIGSMAHADAPTQYRVFDTRTGNTGVLRRTYKEAEIDLWSLKIRNMMHG